MWWILMADEKKPEPEPQSLAVRSTDTHFSAMSDRDELARRHLEIKLENEKLKNLLNRICSWIVDTRRREGDFLAEAENLLDPSEKE